MIETATLVVTDFDGTLADLRVDWVSLKRRLHAEAKCAGLVWPDNKGLDANLRRVRRANGEEAFRRLCAIVGDAECAGFDPNRINAPLVEALKARRNKPLAVFSANTRSGLLAILSHPVFSGLRPFLVAKDDVNRGKPDPEGIERARLFFDVSCQEILFLGDADVDRRASSSAGTSFATFRRCDCITHGAHSYS